jgi:hypothetical protein
LFPSESGERINQAYLYREWRIYLRDMSAPADPTETRMLAVLTSMYPADHGVCGARHENACGVQAWRPGKTYFTWILWDTYCKLTHSDFLVTIDWN